MTYISNSSKYINIVNFQKKHEILYEKLTD